LRARRFIAIHTLLLSAAPLAISAQQVQAALGVSGGSATDVRGITSRALTVSPSVAFTPDPRATFAFDASATRFDNSAWSASLDAGAALRAPLAGPLSLTFNGGAGLQQTSYQLSYRSANAIPALELRQGPLTAYAGVRGAIALASTSVVQQDVAGLFGPGLTTAADSSATRTARGFLVGGSARIVTNDGETLTAGLREEHATIDTVPTVDRSVSLQIAQGRATLGLTLGVRAEPETHATFGNGVLVVDVTSVAAVQLAAGTYPTDHLLGTPAGHYLSLGMSLRTGHSGVSRVAGSENARPIGGGLTRVRVRGGSSASTVEIAGDFTDWRPITAQRGDRGEWYIDLRIPPGQYHYAYREDGGAWQVPDGAPTVEDDFGGKSAWLVVSPPNPSTR
jgi:hypothetical protein